MRQGKRSSLFFDESLIFYGFIFIFGGKFMNDVTIGELYLKCLMDLVPLQSKFFPAKFFFCILEKGNLAGKKLLGKRVNLLCKEGFPCLTMAQDVSRSHPAPQKA